MSKALKTVATIAGAVALVATGVGAFAAAGTALAATAGSVATYAGLAATAASLGAQITAPSAPKPVARGSITQTIVAAEPPRPYPMGETYSAGVLRHKVAYGATLNDVPNPYLWDVVVYSGVGPIEQIVQKQFDFNPIGSYYSGFHATDEQLGEVPESTALVPPYGAATGWGANHKLSGCAAVGWNKKFDKDGKVFSSGPPVQGVVIKGVKCYDPRLDDTFPGGVGPHRLGDESTYTYSETVALHAGMYAYGRYVEEKRVFGGGIPADGINWNAVALWANDCEVNDWRISGSVYEGGEQSGSGVKKANLNDICAAGGGRWFMSGAVLTFDWHRPRVSLATFTDADLVGGGASLILLQTHRERFSAVRPQYRSPDHNWELITGEKIVNSTYVTEDGEERAQAWPLNLVRHEEQAGQLATYAMTDSREIGPVSLTLGANPNGLDWSFYKVGDCLTWDSEQLDDTLKLVIIKRTVNPATLQVEFTFKTETDAKHAYALGQTAVSPATPVIGQTGEERDTVTGDIVLTPDIEAAFGGARAGRATTVSGVPNNNDWNTILTLNLLNSPGGRVDLGGLDGLSFMYPIDGTGTADYEARLQLDGVTLTSAASQNVITGGALSPADFSEMFSGRHDITSGDRTFTIQLRRTSGAGVITETDTALEVTAIAT